MGGNEVVEQTGGGEAEVPLTRAVASESSPGQSGYGLVEVLVAVALIGIVVLAISTAMLTLLRTSQATSEAQRIQAALVSYTESLKASPYRPCPLVAGDPEPTAQDYEDAHADDPSGWKPTATSGLTVTVTRLEFWSAGAAGAFGHYRDTCVAGRDDGRQRLTVRVALTGGKSMTASVVIAEPQIEVEVEEP